MQKIFNNVKYNFKIRNEVFTGGTHIMAILNATPDSFFADSRLQDDAVLRAGKFIEQGARILDIGGQSTRPNAAIVGEEEELSRVLPVVQAVRALYPDVPISVDTFYPNVADACLDAGADMINDVSCLAYEGMTDVIARHGAAVCVMHDRRRTQTEDLFADKKQGLSEAVKKLLLAGVSKDAILLDGGIGFNKGKDEDWTLLNGYNRLMNELSEYPFLLGTSRKSLFGGDVADRLTPTLESTKSAAKWGVLFVRVHDVAQNKAAIDEVLG